jgi:hypothetical protein
MIRTCFPASLLNFWADILRGDWGMDFKFEEVEMKINGARGDVIYFVDILDHALHS